MTLVAEARPDVVVVDAGVSDSTRTQFFARRYPERFFDLGIAEACMIDVAAGLALSGKTVFASSFAIFAAGRAWEQIRQSVAYPKANVKIAATHAGLTIGEDGASAQMLEDIAVMRVLPNMTVLSPADATEAAQAVFAAAQHPGPLYIRLGRGAVPTIFGDEHRFAIGRNTALRTGGDVAILATGVMVAPALEAADALSAEGVAAAVVNVSTMKPLDAEDVAAHAERCGAIVTAEEHSVIGGLGAAVAAALAERCPVPVVRVGVRDRFGRSGTPRELLEEAGGPTSGGHDLPLGWPLYATAHAPRGRASERGTVPDRPGRTDDERVFAVTTHSRLRHPRFFPAMLRATLAVRRDLRRARGLLRVANAIGGPTELFTFSVWTSRDAMHEFMSSGAHEEIMWRWPDWLSAFWLGRLAPLGDECGRWRGLALAPLAARGTPAHPTFVAPAFASHEERPRHLEPLGLGAAAVVIRPRAATAWPAAFGELRRHARAVGSRRPLVHAHGYSLDGELVSLSFWADEDLARVAAAAVATPAGVDRWSMTWRPLDEFGRWDGRRLRHLTAA